MERFRGFKSFLFLILFLPILVMGETVGNDYKTQKSCFKVDAVKGKFIIKESSENNSDTLLTIEKDLSKDLIFKERVKGDTVGDNQNSYNIWYLVDYLDHDMTKQGYINESNLFNEKQGLIDKFKSTFTDKDDTYKDDINSIMQQCIVNAPSKDNQLFKPNNPINRAEFTKIVLLAKYTQSEIDGVEIPKNTFSDISIDSKEWYKNYIYFAKSKDIIKGYDNRTFGAVKNINFSEASKIIVKTLISKEINGLENDNWWTPFTEQLHKFRDLGLKILINPIESLNLTPEERSQYQIKNASDNITRGEMAHIINIILENQNIKEDKDESQTTTTATQSNDGVGTTEDTSTEEETTDDTADTSNEEGTNDDSSVGDEESNSENDNSNESLNNNSCDNLIKTIIYNINQDIKNQDNDDTIPNSSNCKEYIRDKFKEANDIPIPSTSESSEYEWKEATHFNKFKQYTYNQELNDEQNKNIFYQFLSNIIQGDVIQLYWNPNYLTPHTIFITKNISKSISNEIDDDTLLNWADANLEANKISSGTSFIGKKKNSIDKNASTLFNYLSKNNTGATLYRLKESACKGEK